MDEQQVVAEIDRLEQELEQMRRQEDPPDHEDPDRSRRASLQTRIDQLWDLRRRQQAARANDLPVPEDVRDVGTVEGYWQ